MLGGLGTYDVVFSRHSAAKDCKGMPGRVESQQGRESGKWRHRKGLRSSMPRRCCTRSNRPPPRHHRRLLPQLRTAAATGQKTAKECREEWRANKAANQANGVTEKAYVAQCRGGAAPAQPTAAPAPNRQLLPPAPAPAAPAAPSSSTLRQPLLRPDPLPEPASALQAPVGDERIFNRSSG